jgi:hypothetical protein
MPSRSHQLANITAAGPPDAIANAEPLVVLGSA